MESDAWNKNAIDDVICGSCIFKRRLSGNAKCIYYSVAILISVSPCPLNLTAILFIAFYYRSNGIFNRSI